MTPFRQLAGLLQARNGHTAADVGGTITEALAMAVLSTRDRVEHLHTLNQQLHRLVARWAGRQPAHPSRSE